MDMIKLRAPDDVTDCSFGGDNYTVKDGLVEVPRAAAEYLYMFGFANVADDDEKPEPKKTTRKKAE